MSYSENDSCSSSSSKKENTNDDDIADVRQFNFKPVIKRRTRKLMISIRSSSDESENEDSRIGNNKWCLCGGHCRPMQTYTGSLLSSIQTKFQTKCLKA